MKDRQHPVGRMYERVTSMSDHDLMIIWDGLRDYRSYEFYDEDAHITMDDWATAVYSQMSQRNLPIDY